MNYVSVWDDLDSGDANTGIRNHVVTFDGDLALLRDPGLAVSVVGEGGYSIAKFAEEVEDDAELPEAPEADDLVRETDTFIEAGVRAALAEGALGVTALFVNTGPDFFSAAAQSKRVDYTSALSQFNRIGNESARRPVGFFDLSRDPALYTFRLEQQLMRYDPRYNNTLPYGRATPNRRGLRLEADYAPEAGPLAAGVMVAALREIRGQGTEELKDFLLARAEADVALAPLVGYGRDLGLSLGLQAENTSRGGVELEAIDLTSVIVEAGLAAEVYDRLDVLLGAKARTSSGREYVPRFENFNDVDDFPTPFVTNDDEALLGAGVRYRFGEDIYLTVQYQRYTYSDDEAPEADYALGQVFALYRMLF